MKQKKKEQLITEAKRFSFVGVVTTITDYGILNVLAVVFHVPVIVANIISATTASILGYRLNKRMTFEGRRHSRKKTIVIYVIIIAVGIYIIQNSLMLLFQWPLMPVSEMLSHIIPLQARTININLSKMCAGAFVGLWNYLMLRRFVFVPETQKDTVETA